MDDQEPRENLASARLGYSVVSGMAALNESPLYGGLCGAEVRAGIFDFGHGINLSTTYAHFMAPFMVSFEPAVEGRWHPPPWKPASGGLGFNISAQLFIPREFNLSDWFDRLNTIWWFTALIRLRATPLAFVPVVCNEPFAPGAQGERDTYFWPIEIHARPLGPLLQAEKGVDTEALVWIKDHWVAGGTLMRQNSDFNVAFRAFDQCIWTGSPSLSLVSLWGAMERLFSPSPYELRFRVSAAIASFLEAPGEKRWSLHKAILKLYDSRSKAAHGHGKDETAAFIQTYALMKRILFRILEENHVPTREEIEARLFGYTD